jgi:F-type H+-transporting ATPase subunit b
MADKTPESVSPSAHADVAAPGGAVDATHASTEVAHEEGGGLPQFEFQHWFGQIVYLIFLFAILYWLISKVFAPRMRRVFDERETTISTAVATARQVQGEAAEQAAAAKAEVEKARADSRAASLAAKARVTEAANARAAEEEAVVDARIAEAEAAINKSRDAAMTNVAAIAAETASAIVERLTGVAPTVVEANIAVKEAV